MTDWNRREVVALGLSVSARAAGSKIRAALLGIGHAHAAGKAKVLRESTDFELAGVCEPDGDLRRRLGSHAAYRELPWLSLDQLLHDSSIRMVAVESRVHENVAYGQQALAAGKHIHLDKPPGDDLPAFQTLLDRAKQAGLTVQMGYQWRYNPGFQRAVEAARNGWLGEIYCVRCTISSDIPAMSQPGWDGISSRESLARFQGGMMFELGCHMIDRVVDVLGRPAKVTSFLRHDRPARDSLADNTLAVFEYDRAMAEIYTAAQQPSGGVHRRFEVQGTNGTFTVAPFNPPHAEVDLKTPAGPYLAGRQAVELSSVPENVGAFGQFAEVIRGRSKSLFDPGREREVQETLLRACGYKV
jgi:predicted dehydrogenase